MLQRIVVPLDGSRCAAEAFDYALCLAEGEKGELVVCSVVDPVAIVGRNVPDPSEERHVAAAKRDADRIVAKALAKAKKANVRVEAEVVFGNPAIEIVGCAVAAKADTIVMGTHGVSGFKQLFMGSVAREVLRSAPCHVAVVREKHDILNLPMPWPSLERNPPVSVLRLIEVEPKDFERLYGEIASFLNGPGAELPGASHTELLGSFDSTRIAILVEFRSHIDWVHAQWDARLGELLEEIATNSQTLDFDLYHSDRFMPKSTALQAVAEMT